jgi:hypothetical protein
MGTFIQDEKRVSQLVEIIDIEPQDDKETEELQIALLRKYMSKLAKHQRTELSSSEKSLLELDGEDYNRIVHSK